MSKGSVLLFAFAFVLGPAGARAEPVPPTLPSYGRLLGANDEPVTGAHKLTFRIYDGDRGGTARWTATYDVVLSAEGVYEVLLGSDPHPFNLVGLAEGPRWLSVGVDAGAELEPRLAFGSVLYAHRAQVATNVSGGIVEGVVIKSSTLEAPTITGGTISDARIVATSIEATSLTTPSLTVSATIGAPFQVSSPALVANLNAELFNGRPSADYLLTGDAATTYLSKGEATTTYLAKADQRGYANLARNTSFENFGRGPATLPNRYDLRSTLGGQSEIKRVAGYDGEFAVAILDSEIGNRVSLEQTLISTPSPSLLGKTFTAAIRYRRVSGSSTGQLCLADAGARGAEVSPTCVELLGTAGWALANVTRTAAADASYLKVYFAPTTQPGDSGEYHFDTLSVVEGDAVPYYEAAAEDVFSGMIALFPSTCPRGWSEYQGLRGRFPRGEPTGDASSLDAGGSDDAVVVSHTHTVTATAAIDGNHSHVSEDMHHKNPGPSFASWNYIGGVANTGDAYNVGIPIKPAGDHSHAITAVAASAGASGVGQNVPAYREMIFCTKE